MSSRKGQRGLALIFALLGLVALSIAAVALVRSVDTGTLVLGNIGFKQETTAQADQATQAAIEWLANADKATLEADQVASGYLASATAELDPLGQRSDVVNRILIDWDFDQATLANCATVPNTPAERCVTPGSVQGNTAVRYFITRLCATTGDKSAAGNHCANPVSITAGEASARGAVHYRSSDRLAPSGGGLLYRIIVRSKGARDTTTFTETIVQIPEKTS